MDQPDLRSQRLAVAQACRVLAFAGLAQDVLGHVSVRTGPDSLLVRCRGPRESGLLFTTPDDVHEVSLDGPHDLPGGYTVPSELPIHVETLRSRPEVAAVVHAHPPAIVTADLAGLTLRPVVGAYNIPATRQALHGVGVYPRGVLIRRAELASEMLAAMSGASACVLRGHGVTTTGPTIAEAVITTLNLESLARVILGAAQSGGHPPNLPDADVAELPDLGGALNSDSVWRYHLARLEHAGLGLTA
jgi:ribulose-5-phosphate 4-epimerase/fuculose-1-phosphate aldolase